MHADQHDMICKDLKLQTLSCRTAHSINYRLNGQPQCRYSTTATAMKKNSKNYWVMILNNPEQFQCFCNDVKLFLQCLKSHKPNMGCLRCSLCSKRWPKEYFMGFPALPVAVNLKGSFEMRNGGLTSNPTVHSAFGP